MPYDHSEAQKRFLRKKYATEKDEERSCDCPGCDSCAGFIRNCHCDDDTGFLRRLRGTPQ